MTSAHARLAAALAAGPSLLLLVGEPGSGRAAGVAGAARELGIASLDLNLDGFENAAEDGLGRYLAVRVRKAPELQAAAARLTPLAAALPVAHRAAALLAVLLASPGEDSVVDVPFEPGAALREVLRARVAAAGRLALLVRAEELTGPLARELAAVARDTPGLHLCLAVAPGDEEVPRFLLPDVDLATVPRVSVELTEASREALSSLAALFDRLELDVARELEAFLDGAALLSPNVPADVAGFLAGRGSDAAETLLDRVDDELVDGDGEPVLWDFEYSHPSFPGQPVYRFVRPELARAIVARWAPEERQRRAREAFERLAPRLPADSRGRACLLLSLARAAELALPRRRLLAELALAGDATEVAELSAHGAELLARGLLTPGEVLAMVEGTEGRWPLGRRLAVVSGLRGHTTNAEEEAGQAFLEARFLAESGRTAEAVSGARAALAATEKAFPESDPRTASATNLLGLLLVQTGDLAAATPLLERTVAILGTVTGLEPGILAGARGRLGDVFRRQGRAEAAREQFVAVHELLRSAVGDAHPAVAGALNDLALANRDLGRLEEAAALHRQALEVHRRALGPDHPNLALDWNNLGSVEQQRGRLAEARQAFEAAVALLRHTPEAPPESLVVALANLAGVMRVMGQEGESREHLAEAARRAEEALGPDHGLTRDLVRALAGRATD